MDFAGAGGWLRLDISNTGGRAAVKAVSVKGGNGGDWAPLSNSWGATWELAAAPPAPLSFKVPAGWGGAGRGGRARGCAHKPGLVVPLPRWPLRLAALTSPPRLPSASRLWATTARRWWRLTW